MALGVTRIDPTGTDKRGDALVKVGAVTVHVMRLGASWTYRHLSDGPMYRHREDAIAAAVAYAREVRKAEALRVHEIARNRWGAMCLRCGLRGHHGSDCPWKDDGNA